MKKLNKLSIESSTDINNVVEPCLVCGSSTSTLHYQIIICYACAAFYRRSIKIHPSYVCQRNDGKCNIANRKTGKPMCRFCRYNKCLKVGIRDHKTENGNKKPPEEKLCKEEVQENFPISESFDKVFNKAIKILEEKPLLTSILPAKTNYIEEFSKLLFSFMEETKPKQTLVLIKSDNIRLNFLKDFYLNTATMLSNFRPFANLPLKEKIILHQEFWQNFHTLERSYQACKCFGHDQNDYRIPLDNFQYYDCTKSERHFEKYANYKPYKIFFQPLIEKAVICHTFIKKMKITEFEFIYICLLLLWNRYELSELHDSTHELGAKIISQVSDDLHNYYIDELRMHSYAARQAQLFKLTHMIEFCVREKRKMITAKNLFDFSEDNFPYCTFELNYYDFINKRSP